MKHKSGPYDHMTASDLARVTRERGLTKPDVITLREWADFLEVDDAKRLQPLPTTTPETDDAPDNMGTPISEDADGKPARVTGKKTK